MNDDRTIIERVNLALTNLNDINIKTRCRISKLARFANSTINKRQSMTAGGYCFIFVEYCS